MRRLPYRPYLTGDEAMLGRCQAISTMTEW
jgi:hypothetical protein